MESWHQVPDVQVTGTTKTRNGKLEMGNGEMEKWTEEFEDTPGAASALFISKHNNRKLDISCVRSGLRDYVSGRSIPRNMSPVQRVLWNMVLLSKTMVL